MATEKELYMEEQTPANELKGFTKSFQKKSKDKKAEDKNVVELLAFNREKKLVFGTRVTEKAFRNGKVKKVYTASNCDELTLNKIKHYAKIASVDVVELDLDNDELSEKVGKPFQIQMVHVRA